MGAPWKRRFLLETIISRFHVNFWGCNSPLIRPYFCWGGYLKCPWKKGSFPQINYTNQPIWGVTGIWSLLISYCPVPVCCFQVALYPGGRPPPLFRSRALSLHHGKEVAHGYLDRKSLRITRYHLDVSKNRGILPPKWMVYKGEPY